MSANRHPRGPGYRSPGSAVPAAFQDLVNKALDRFSDRHYLGRSDLSVLVLLSLSAGEPAPTSLRDRGEALRAIFRDAVETFRPRDREPDPWVKADRTYLVLRDGFIQGTTVQNKAVYLSLRYGPSERTFYHAIKRARSELADRLWGLLVEYVRHANLSPETWRGLEILAVFETGVRWTVAEQALAAADVADPNAVLAELYRRHLMDKRHPDVLLLPLPVRLLVYQSLPPGALEDRHRIAAETCKTTGDPLAAAEHFRLAEDHPAAASVLIPQADVLITRGQAKQLLEELSKIVIRLLSDSEQVALLVARGKAHQEMGQWDEALIHFSEAAPRLKHNRQVWAEVQHRMGKICERQSAYEEAIHHYRSALTALVQEGPLSKDWLRLWILVQKDRAMLHDLQGEHGRALQLCEEALQALGTAHGFDIERAELSKAQGTIHRNQGNYADAIACYERALEFARAGNHVGLQGEAYEGLGIVHDNQGRYLAALDHYERARAFYERLGNRFFIARVMINIGVIHFHQGAWDQATAAYEDALGVFRQSGDQRGVAIAYTNMAEARLFQARGSEERLSRKLLIEASDYAWRAVELCGQQVGETADVMPDALRLLADIHVEMSGRAMALPEEVLALLRRALRLAQKTKNRYIEAFIRETLGRVLWGRGKGDQARREYARARDIFAQLGNAEQADRLNIILDRLRFEERGSSFQGTP